MEVVEDGGVAAGGIVTDGFGGGRVWRGCGWVGGGMEELVSACVVSDMVTQLEGLCVVDWQCW